MVLHVSQALKRSIFILGGFYVPAFIHVAYEVLRTHYLSVGFVGFRTDLIWIEIERAAEHFAD
jgi:hypothetical protein